LPEHDVVECTKRLKPWIIRTPLVESEALSDIAGSRVYLKLETFQKTGAFKFRGAINYLLSLDADKRQKGVVTASSGNHGLGMSLGSKLLGLECKVVMPTSAPVVKQERARGYGATVVLNGHSYDEAALYARNLAEKEGCVYVPSFNHPAIMEGQGTILAEISEDLPDVECVIAPIGGGGLLAGLLLARSGLGIRTEIIGVEPEGAASMNAAMKAGELVTLESLNTIADGVAVKTAGDLTFDIIQREKPGIVVIDDDSIRKAQRIMKMEAKVLSEPAGAVSVAGMLKLSQVRKFGNVVCVVTGANMDEAG
jgi:threonine dehydratase